MLFCGLKLVALILVTFASGIDLKAGRKGGAATIEKKDRRAAAGGAKVSRGERKKDKAGRALAYTYLRKCLMEQAEKEGWTTERFAAECAKIGAAFSDDYDADSDSE